MTPEQEMLRVRDGQSIQATDFLSDSGQSTKADATNRRYFIGDHLLRPDPRVATIGEASVRSIVIGDESVYVHISAES
jgi:hypothetical protein